MAKTYEECFGGMMPVRLAVEKDVINLKQSSHQRVRDYVSYIERRAFEKEMEEKDMNEWLMGGLRQEIFREIPVYLRKRFLHLSWNDMVAAAQDAEWLWCLRNKQPFYFIDSKKLCNNNTKGFVVDSDDYVIVYTDGACLHNGKTAGAKAGIGVWFDEWHYLNVGKPLDKKDPPTNNVAEIKAVIEALEIVKQYGANRVAIHTDSQFLIDSITIWIQKWIVNGWMKSDGRPLKNKFQFQELLCAMEDLDVKWVHVKAHRKIFGNTMAHDLARRGARRYGLSNKVRSRLVC